MGLLGTLVYAGLTISSVVSPFLLTRVDSPWPVLSWALVLSAGAAVACAFAPNWYFLAAARFAVGLAHGCQLPLRNCTSCTPCHSDGA